MIKMERHAHQCIYVLMGMSICALVYFVVLFLYVKSGIFLEIREFANTHSAINIKNLNNISNWPLNIYLYGAAQPYLLSLFPQHYNLFIINRILCVLGLLISSILIVVPSYRYSKDNIIGCMVFGLAFFSFNMMSLLSNAGRPDMLGVLLTSFAYCYCLSGLFRKRNVFVLNVFVCTVVTIFSYFTKQYIASIYIAFVIFTFFYHGKLYAIKFFACSCVLIVVSLFILHINTQPLLALAHHLKVTGNNLNSSLGQIKEIIKSLNLILLLFLCPLIFVKRDDMYALYCSVLFYFVFLLITFGGHGGNYLVYYQQTLYPPLFILALLGYTSVLKNKQMLKTFFACVLLIVTVFPMQIKAISALSKFDTSSTHELVAYIDKSKNAISSPSTANLFYSQNKEVFDAGQLEYINTVNMFATRFFYNIDEINQKFHSTILENINNVYYDYIFLDPCSYMARFKVEISNAYKLVYSVSYNGWPVEVWERR